MRRAVADAADIEQRGDAMAFNGRLAGAAAIVALMTVAACGESEEASAPAAPSEESAVASAVEAATEAAEEVAEEAAEVAEEAAEAASETVEAVVEEAAEVVEEVAEEAGEIAEDAAEVAEDVVEDVVEAASDAGEAVAETAGDAVEAVVGAADGDIAAQIAALGGDAATGQRLFRQCQACHVVNAEQNRTGPHLVGVIGRPAGIVEGFRYSPANSGSGIVWTPDILVEYLQDPRGYMPGTTMAFRGLRSAEDAAHVIAYMADEGGVYAGE